MQKRPERPATGSCLFFCLFIFLLFLSSPAVARQGLFDHFTTAEGLPSNMAYRCVRDADGFIWIATSGGVARFDGQSFETFSEADGLPDNDVINLYSDQRNRVWFFGFNGHTSFYANGTIHTAATDKWLKPLQSDAFVMYIAEDRQRNMYIVYNNCSIIHVMPNDSAAVLPEPGNLFFAHDRLWRLPGEFAYTRGKFFHSIYGHDSLPIPHSLLDRSIQRMTFEPTVRGNLFCLRPGKLYLLTNDGFSAQLLYNLSQPVSRLKFLDDTCVAILTQGEGFFLYSMRQKKLTEHLLSGETVTDVLMNGNGDIWCTSLNNGLFYLPASRARTQYITAGNVLANEKCTAVYVGNNGEVWAGMDNAQVQVFRQGKPVRLIRLTGNRESFGRINNILPLRNGSMCVASDVGLFLTAGDNDLRAVYYRDGKKVLFPLAAIKSCSITPGGNILVATSTFAKQVGAASVQDRVPMAQTAVALPDRVLCAFEDSHGNTWLGTARGLVRIHGTDIAPLYAHDSRLTRRILQIGETRSGYIVLVTDGAGLMVLDKEKICFHLTARNGLVSNSCRKMRIAGDTVLVATASGVAIAGYNPSSGIFTRAVTEKDGLLSADCRDVALYQGHLYVATDKGIAILPLQDVFLPGSQPVTYLKKILADGKALKLNDGRIKLKYGVRSLMVNYGAVSQHATGGIEYRYRTGPGAAWIVTDAPSFVYNDPQPQEMEVIVQSRYKSGTWDKGKKLLITIVPLFYQQAWFICFVIIVVLTTAGAAMIFYYRRQRQKLYNQNRLVKLESQASQAMMNPHFVFNALNSVQHFLNENDNYAANQYLTRFSRLIRRHLELNRRQYISLEEEFDFLRLYLEVEKSRCEDRLVFGMQVQQGMEPDELYLPVLIVQPLVENAIWHGINPRAEGGHIIITASVNEMSQMEIQIADNGVGFQYQEAGSNHESMGIGIIRDRLQLLTKLYGQEFSVHYKPVTEGVTVMVRFPLLRSGDLLPVF